MKNCTECNCEMIENCKIEGKHSFEYGMDGKSNMYIEIPTGKKHNVLGMSVDERKSYPIKARTCPKCGKIELYMEMN